MVIREGDPESAGLLLEEIVNLTNEGNRADEANYLLLKGEIELYEGNESEALEHLETANTLQDSPYYQESLALYYYRLGDWEKAIPIYESIIENSRPMGWEGQDCWIQSHIQLGKAYEEVEDSAGAIEYYNRFLELWKNADSELPDLLYVKSRLEQLEAV